MLTFKTYFKGQLNSITLSDLLSICAVNITGESLKKYFFI